MQKGNNDMILLKNVRPYDKSADVQDILICGRDIIEIAPNIDVPERLIEQTIDGGGLVAAPGYIDQHVHITGGGGEGGFSNQVPPLKLSQLVAAQRAELPTLLPIRRRLTRKAGRRTVLPAHIGTRRTPLPAPLSTT